MATTSMTPRERMKAVLSGALPDRVPFFPTIFVDHACVACGKEFEDALTNPAVGQECMLGAALRYQTDVVRFLMGPPEAWYAEKRVAMVDGRLAQFSRRDDKLEGYFDVAGGGSLVPLEKPKPVSTVADAKAIPVPTADEYMQQGCLKDVARHVRTAHDQGLFVVGMCGGQTIGFMVEKLGGTAPALMAFYDDPELATALIAKAVAISIEKGRAYVKAGVDCIYIGDSFASGSVISPAVYRRFCVPAYAEAASEFHGLGVFCYKHCCGNYNPLLDDFVTVGVDAMDGMDPTSGMSVRRTKERIGDRATLMGGVSCLTLLGGTASQVYEEAKQCVLDGKPGGRYVLGSACAVPRRTPAENLMAARSAAIDFGGYEADAAAGN
jgi:uroporphyrinogen-III decarboxylase